MSERWRILALFNFGCGALTRLKWETQRGQMGCSVLEVRVFSKMKSIRNNFDSQHLRPPSGFLPWLPQRQVVIFCLFGKLVSSSTTVFFATLWDADQCRLARFSRGIEIVKRHISVKNELTSYKREMEATPTNFSQFNWITVGGVHQSF